VRESVVGAVFVAAAVSGFKSSLWVVVLRCHLEETLALLRPGGVYVIDDLLPQPNWPEGHAPKVPILIETLERRNEFASVKLAQASGVMVVVRKAAG
jgi:hypothetical protein